MIVRSKSVKGGEMGCTEGVISASSSSSSRAWIATYRHPRLGRNGRALIPQPCSGTAREPTSAHKLRQTLKDLTAEGLNQPYS